MNQSAAPCRENRRRWRQPWSRGRTGKASCSTEMPRRLSSSLWMVFQAPPTQMVLQSELLLHTGHSLNIHDFLPDSNLRKSFIWWHVSPGSSSSPLHWGNSPVDWPACSLQQITRLELKSAADPEHRQLWTESAESFLKLSVNTVPCIWSNLPLTSGSSYFLTESLWRSAETNINLYK